MQNQWKSIKWNFKCCVLCVKKIVDVTEKGPRLFFECFMWMCMYKLMNTSNPSRTSRSSFPFFSLCDFLVTLLIFKSQTTLNPISTLISSPTFYKRFICRNNSKSCRQSLSVPPYLFNFKSNQTSFLHGAFLKLSPWFWFCELFVCVLLIMMRFNFR